MASRNPLTVTGNLVADPESFTTSGGRSGVRLTVAENIGFKGQDGKFQEDEPAFWPVTVWDDGIARNVAASLSKGDRVTVVGKYRNAVWEGEDGVRRSRLEITADDVSVSLRWATAKPVRSARKADEPPVPAFAGEPPF